MEILPYHDQFHQLCNRRFFQLPEILMEIIDDAATKCFWKLHQWIQHSGKNFHEVQQRTAFPERWIPEELQQVAEEDYDTFLSIRWIYNSYEGWAKLFRVKVGTVRRVFKLLHQFGLIHTAQFGKSGMDGRFDRRLWVAINYKNANKLINAETLDLPDVQKISLPLAPEITSSYISKENSSKNTHNNNREDAAECVSEFKSLENNPEVLPFLSKVEMAEQPQDFELPTDNSFSVGQIKQELSAKQTIPHEDQIIAPSHDATQQDTPKIAEKPIIDTEVKAKRDLVEGMGIMWNPKLKAILSSYSLEQVVKAIAHIIYIQEDGSYAIRNKEGFLVDAVRDEYLEYNPRYLQLGDFHRERLFWIVQAIAHQILPSYAIFLLNFDEIGRLDGTRQINIPDSIEQVKKYGWRSLKEELIKQNTPPTA